MENRVFRDVDGNESFTHGLFGDRKRLAPEVVIIGRAELDHLVAWHERMAEDRGMNHGFNTGFALGVEHRQFRLEAAFTAGVLISALVFMSMLRVF